MHKGLQGNEVHKASDSGMGCAMGRGMTKLQKLQAQQDVWAIDALRRDGYDRHAEAEYMANRKAGQSPEVALAETMDISIDSAKAELGQGE